MNNIFEILYKSKEVFERLDNLYEEDLDSNSKIIVAIFGAFIGFFSCITEYGYLRDIVQMPWLILLFVFLILMSSGICIVLYYYIFIIGVR